MSNIRISAVSYLNTKPFIYGIEQSGLMNEVELSLDIPSVCAEKLLSGTIDLGLIPVAIIPQLNAHHLISDFCIGADGDVDSVKLFSRVPLNEIEKVFLDYQSKTSVMLAKVLANKLWNIRPQFVDAKENFEKEIAGKNAAVVIGDRALEMKDKFSHELDLAGEWKKLTGLPFVFACWVSNKKLPAEFIGKFNAALAFGVNNIEKMIGEKNEKQFSAARTRTYLTKNISYAFDKKKKEAMQLFLEMTERLLLNTGH